MIRSHVSNKESTLDPVGACAFILRVVGVVLAVGSSGIAHALETMGADTTGGTVPGAEIVHVTSLADDGPGSLREAVNNSGPRIVVFDVSGYIYLKDDLLTRAPYLTIAGQTAPPPGIVLRGAGLRIHSHDIVVEHLAVYPGPSDDPKVNDNRDAIAIDASGRGGPGNESVNIILSNLSAGWAVDETFNTWFPTTRRITLEDSIIAETLRNAGHPKGPHSMALLVGKGTTGALVAGNLITSSDYRNPVVHCRASAAILNNLIYNPGRTAMHFYPCEESGTTKAALIGNVVISGPSSRAGLSAISIPVGMLGQGKSVEIYQSDTLFKASPGAKRLGPTILDLGLVTLAANSPVDAPSWTLLPSTNVEDFVLGHAGMQPANRNPIDQRIVEDVRDRAGRIIDSPSEVGGWPEIAPLMRVAEVPDRPLSPTGQGKPLRIAAWLCLRHFEVGGAKNTSCPLNEAAYREMLSD